MGFLLLELMTIFFTSINIFEFQQSGGDTYLQGVISTLIQFYLIFNILFVLGTLFNFKELKNHSKSKKPYSLAIICYLSTIFIIISFINYFRIIWNNPSYVDYFYNLTYYSIFVIILNSIIFTGILLKLKIYS